MKKLMLIVLALSLLLALGACKPQKNDGNNDPTNPTEIVDPTDPSASYDEDDGNWSVVV